ncbi:MAG: MerR family transcriptional regulator, partial [Cellulosimicrobium cellulans]
MSPKGEAGGLKQSTTAGVALPASGAQGLLFTEDLPVLDEDAGYRGP